MFHARAPFTELVVIIKPMKAAILLNWNFYAYHKFFTLIILPATVLSISRFVSIQFANYVAVDFDKQNEE